MEQDVKLNVSLARRAETRATDGSLRRRMRWWVVAVLVLDAAVGAVLATGALKGGEQNPAKNEAQDEAAAYTAESLRRLGRTLAARAQELDRREAELQEALRGGEVLRRAGLEAPAAAEPARNAAAGEATDRRDESFGRLQRAYENMEPESAAMALSELAGRDKQAVVELLLGWQPRVSGSILDALTQTDAGLAADLSYEIWKRSGNARPDTARSGR